MPAYIENPRKNFNFSAIFSGLPLNPFLIQEFDLPSFDIDVVAHGDTNHDIKTGGRIKFDAVKMKKLMVATGPDTWLYTWLILIQDVLTGGGQLPMIYKRSLTVFEYSNDNSTPINTWLLEGCWPNKLDAIQLRRLGSENTMESLELQVDKIFKL